MYYLINKLNIEHKNEYLNIQNNFSDGALQNFLETRQDLPFSLIEKKRWPVH
jgi:hypothetical protein